MVSCDGTTLWGDNLIVSGDGNIINGNNAKVSGDGNTINGNNAEVSGDGNTINGNNAKVSGDGNTINGNNAEVDGDGNRSYGNNNQLIGVVSGTSNIARAKTVVFGDNWQSIDGLGHHWQSFDGMGRSINRLVQSITGAVTHDGMYSIRPTSVIGRRPRRSRELPRRRRPRLGPSSTGQTTIDLTVGSSVDSSDTFLVPTSEECAKDKSAADESQACAICLDHEARCVTVPCGHKKVCATCAVKLKERNVRECTICRKPVTQYIIVY